MWAVIEVSGIDIAEDLGGEQGVIGGDVKILWTGEDQQEARSKFDEIMYDSGWSSVTKNPFEVTEVWNDRGGLLLRQY